MKQILIFLFLLVIVKSAYCQINKNRSSFNILFSHEKYEITEEFYKVLDLEPINKEQYGYYTCVTTKKCGDLNVAVTFRMYNCASSHCYGRFDFFLFSESKIVSQLFYNTNFQETPIVNFFHETFFLVTKIEDVFVLDENENPMPTGKKEDKSDVFVVHENKIYALNELSKENLRIYRNLIFAKYGYKFKSKDLQDYFLKFTWYKPKYDNADQFVNENDKEILSIIQRYEKS